MNNLLHLKGTFYDQKNPNHFGPSNLPKNKFVTSDHILQLIHQLKNIKNFWLSNNDINGALVSVHYIQVIAKTNRIKSCLSEKGKSPNNSIRGSKFGYIYKDNNKKKNHIFTHYVKIETIQKTIDNLSLVFDIISSDYDGKINYQDIKNIQNGIYLYKEKINQSTFINLIIDAYFVYKFSIDKNEDTITERSIVTIYQTDVDTNTLLSKLGIDMINAKKIDETTLRLMPDEIKLIQEKAPYLISMHVTDLSKISKYSKEEDVEEGIINIPSPGNEPTIGVFDTHFDENVYFHEWVDYKNMLDDGIELTSEDFLHGTAISSIIVDGPTFNPQLEDGCGRFKVRHFGVATASRFSSFTILKIIRQVVAQNRDIKVWNLSLGSELEINQNFISPEAAELDKIQSEYDVIFIVSGTNNYSTEDKKIGAPADSINSLVVNSVKMNGSSASYTRTGPVLSFFHKPDISYYGGDTGELLTVCEPLGEARVGGTSFAAPWISRKMAYLIHVLGLSRELAKALIIDAAAGWNRKDNNTHSIGYGIVPIHINDIVSSKDDEIKFLLNGVIKEYITYTYNIPVPIYKGKHPFFARATLCYFPKCSRNQGVDYTSTEMDIRFGRIEEKNGKVKIHSINGNIYDEDSSPSLFEEEQRNFYRKWDNIKHINDIIKDKSKSRKVYDAGMWGLSIRTKERLNPREGRGLKFGVVVTLKEMNGTNRINDFIKLCQAKGWLVNEISVSNQIDIYNKAEETIEWE